MVLKCPVDYGVNDQRVGLGVWYVDPMIFPGESSLELRPTQRLWSFSIDVPDLPCVRSELPLAFGRLAATDDEVDLSVG
jgi:hypothetical protein